MTYKRQSGIGGKRILGYDLARGIAVFGMFLMNFKIVMQGSIQEAEGFWPRLLLACEGRFGVLFIILAGMGVSLMTRKSRQEKDEFLLAQKRKVIWTRAGFLFVTGLLYLPVWEADILHYYGIYIGLAVLMLTWSDKRLWSVLALTTAGFVGLFFLFDWEAGWNWQALSYVGIWSPEGFLRNTLFNGFHPLFPWFAFFIFGMVMGRKDWSNPALQQKGLGVFALVVLLCELVSQLLLPAMGNPLASFYLNTLAFPPFPLFVVSGSASAMVVVILCVILSEKISGFWLRPFIVTGQMVLTHYVAHVFIGMFFLEAIGRLYQQELGFIVLFSIGYFILSVLFSMVWTMKFSKGPLEMIMREISG